MNKENLLKVADAIEALDRGEQIGPIESFDMETFLFVDHCGTAGCIAGVAASLADQALVSRLIEQSDFGSEVPDVPTIARLAQDYLELTDREADNLFLGDWYHRNKHITARFDITVKDAATHLRKLAKDDT